MTSPHKGFRQVRQIPFPEVTQGELPQPLCQAQAGILYLVIHQPVGGLVLLHMGHKGERHEQEDQSHKEKGAGQRPSAGQSPHKFVHQQI